MRGKVNGSMHVLFAASEAVPIVKTGGLADVVGALPKALAPLGIDAAVILPLYGETPAAIRQSLTRVGEFRVRLGWRNQRCELMRTEQDGIVYYLIGNDYYYDRGSLYGYDDEAERFVFFCFAVLEAMPLLERRPAVLHCHDWQTGLIPFLLRTRYSQDPGTRDIRSVFTIHNLRYQGVFSRETLADLLSIGDDMFTSEGLEFYGGGSCMKGGLAYADKLTTVSRAYAEEIQTEAFGEGLDGMLRKRKDDLAGIVNGIDAESFDPMNDASLAFPYKRSLGKKRMNKIALQQRLGLTASKEAPLIGIVSRLVEQKGLDLVEAMLDALLNLEPDVQLAVLGTGDPRYEELFRKAAAERPERVAVRLAFDDALARQIYAGSDLYLMPSQFEPCGLSQLIALRYGSVPIVRETGGLRDTIQAYDEYTGRGTGFSFRHYDADELLHTVRRALALYRDDAKWQHIVDQGVGKDYSWSSSAREYRAVYRELAGYGKG